MRADQIIIEPVLTEKSNVMKETGRYVFKVDPRANKLEVRRAVESLFGVHPVQCNIINVKGKPKRVRYKNGYTASWKKAVVTLREGESISALEGA